MKSNITKKLTALKRASKKAFLPFIMAGDPNLATTERLLYTLESSGASIIELGMPFSDPMADGPIIQRASSRALASGTTLKKILLLVKKARKKTNIPILLMGYYNPLLQYGIKRLVRDANQAGVDALLIVDLPLEESTELSSALKPYPMDLIYLVTPTSTSQRLKKTGQKAKGFVYYVSYTGITGANRLNPKEVAEKFQRLRQYLKIPLMIGFGISSPAHIRQLAPLAEGMVVGSAIVKLIEKYGRQKRLLATVERYVSSLVKAL